MARVVAEIGVSWSRDSDVSLVFTGSLPFFFFRSRRIFDSPIANYDTLLFSFKLTFESTFEEILVSGEELYYIYYRLWSNEERERGRASIYSAIIYDSNLFDKFSSLSLEIYIYTNTWKLVFQALSNEYATPILR